MERIKLTKNFYLDEFVDPHTYFNSLDNGLSLIDEKIIDIAQLLRTIYGKPIYINNWWLYYTQNYKFKSIETIILNIEKNKNINKWSGLRTNRCKIGSKTSAHRPLVDNVCKAIDPKGNESKMFKIVEKYSEIFYFLGVRRLEDISITKGWLHIDTLEKNTQPNSIRVIDRVKCTKTIYIKKQKL
jgi:hypothetical protein